MAKEIKLTGNIKGVVSKYSDNSFEFRPFGKGEPVYEEKQDFKNGVTIAKTRGVNGKKVVRLMLDNSDDDLRFSEVMFNSVVAWQDAYFGQMLQDSWENADKAFVPRVRRSKNADGYLMLPQEFKNADVQKHLDIDRNAANQQIQRWVKAGYAEKLEGGRYKKVFDFII